MKQSGDEGMSQEYDVQDERQYVEEQENQGRAQ
jgi:hypothetical protein